MIIHRNNTTETVILSGVGENILVVERRLRSGGRIASHLAATVARDQRSRWKVVQRGRIQLIMVGSGAQTLLELSYTLSTRLTWLDRKGFARTRIRSSGDDIVVATGIYHGIPNARSRASARAARGATFAIGTAVAARATWAITIGVVTSLTATTTTTTTNDHCTSSRYRQHAHPVHLQIIDRSEENIMTAVLRIPVSPLREREKKKKRNISPSYALLPCNIITIINNRYSSR